MLYFDGGVAMKAVKERAYAKINLYLDVTAKRHDGFHDVETVMHTVSLCDELTVSVTPSRTSSVTMELPGERRLPTDDKNIAVKAAKLYLDRAGITDKVNISLIKNIPIAAGLAGGSADAAATLRALNRIYGKRFTDKMLVSLAAELGSDVPFCLIGGTALCLGRGERMERLDDALKLHVVVAVANGEYVSTPAAYSALDTLYSDFDGSVPRENDGLLDALMLGIKSGCLEPRSLFNVFENAIFKICSGAELLKSKMTELGATASLMSGSGPSVFGIFDSKDEADSAVAALCDLGFRAYAADTV